MTEEIHNAAAEAARLVRDVLDGGTGVHPASPEAVFALAGIVIAEFRRIAAIDGVTGEDETRAWIRRLLDSQIEEHTLAGLAAERSTARPAETPPPAVPEPGRAVDPVFDAALWDFIAAVQAGTARPSRRRDFDVASCLVGMWEEITAEFHVVVQGVTIGQARAKVAELVAAQRALYGSLAAGGR